MQAPLKKPMPLIPLTEIEEKEMEWLWYPYIPARDATMIVGPGGIGKSHITVDIAARVSRGDSFPFLHDKRRPEKVLMLSAEDDPSYVLKPRLRKAGADLSNVFIPPGFFTIDKEGLRTINYYIHEVTVGVVFLDPVVAYVGGKIDINKANEVRQFVGGLQNIAREQGVPIIYVHHTRKGQEGREADRALGSADFVNGSRSTLYVTKAPNGDRIMQHVKSNYAPEGPTLSYQFGDNGFEWTGVYEEDGVKSKGAKRSTAADWIKKKLAKGPVPASEIEHDAGILGFNHRTLIRAKEGLAESFLVSKDGKMQWYWKLKVTEDDATDLPVMGSKWADQKSPVEREINAREDERAGVTAEKLAPTGRILDGGSYRKPGPLSDEELEAWMKDNL